MKKNLKRFYVLVLGFIIGCLFVSILIFIGYYHANAISVKSYTVTNCSFFAFVALMIEEVWLRLVRRRQKCS
ncbi:LlsX family protein [Streptococcus mutans]|uniref:LlsX family protein n=1 Tax=Streptococcus mutans TaxID=1309 RepID=UPI0002B59678|nr:LlsX family protein [Streptococcus mutans]EMB85622.1 hypothetical protein SMU56_08269 [Streptococcus mutans N29]MCB5051775.1 LlsX family protein [Streptococcus mutans]